MSFDYREAVDLKSLTRFSVAELRDHLRHALAGGWRVLAFFGIPDEDAKEAVPGQPVPVSLCCVLAHDGTRRLMARRTPPVTAFVSMTPDLPQLHYFEREIYEQWGVEPVGHPWLKSVRRAPDTFEAQTRNAAAASGVNVSGTNISGVNISGANVSGADVSGAESAVPHEAAPAAAPTDTAVPPSPAQPYPFYRVEGVDVHEVAVGPVHAGIIEPGHFRFQCYGENVLHLEIALGYQHRGLESMLVHGPAARRLPLLECAAGDSTVAHATAYCVVVERMKGQQPDERAQLVRRIGLELERLANHTGDLGAIAGDTGFLPTASWNGRIRGDFLNMTASLCGNRFGRGLLRPGGVAHDLSPQECADLLGRVRAAWQDARGSVDVMLDAVTVRNRLAETGSVEPSVARELGLVGVAARACGLDVDARFHMPLSDLSCENCAPRLEITGDVMARTCVRSRELDDSLRLLELDLTRLAALPGHPGQPCQPSQPSQKSETSAAWPASEGPTPPTHTTPLQAALATAGHESHGPATDFAALPPHTLAVAQVEGWRGEVCHVALTDSQGRILVYKVIDPSFHNWTGLAVALRGNQISDFPLCNKSFNLSYCGHDL
ncbi:hydrogenase [Desulfovibrio sp. 86]|uniref:NAD-dependent dehydrogenase subunit n=1 Tax=uncultured Desulfovibrio sp. TaxID=167968 RepID=A0A212L991_9BACT|nr:hydrogenase [Desulfovibrio sp. 86]SCM74080.1 NAD-dependent dehydrogenase subunit [uncultured Desulfovibrio sp.]VZH34624.1 NAD-dependent dehydrogenase subunit [Desulfovibrio sp. 86]